MMLSTIKQNKFKIGGAFFCLILWETFAQGLKAPLIIPPIKEILSALFVIIKTPETYIFILSSLIRILITLAIDSFIAFLLGIASGLNKNVEAFLSAPENILKSSPTISVLLLALIWFKSNMTPIFVTSLIVLPLLYRNIVDGVKNIDKGLIEMSYDFNIPFGKRLKSLYLPCIRPFLKNGYILSTGFTVKVVIMAEVLSQPKYGIGSAFQTAKIQIETASIFAWTGIAVLLAAFLQKGVKKIL